MRIDGAASHQARRRGRPAAVAPDGLLSAHPRDPAFHLVLPLEHRRLPGVDPQLVHRAHHGTAPACAAPLRLGLHPLLDAPLRLPLPRCERVPRLRGRGGRLPDRRQDRRARPPEPLEDPRAADPGDPGRDSRLGADRCSRRRRERIPEQLDERRGHGVVGVLRHDRRRRLRGVLRLVRVRRARPDAARLPGLRGLRPALLGPDHRLPALPDGPLPELGPAAPRGDAADAGEADHARP